ncbi:hypothetical protein F4604DRAFT_1915119 [Suillus subluteus]|nr:hypothetical protein F4604DRAFT_1915119 [Suillus subluteus]
MKVFLPAIEGHVPADMVCTFHALLEFCYLAWHDVVTKDTLKQIQDALHRFHRYRKIFDLIVPTFSLPRQHSMIHYVDMIRLFGAPNGLCSLITKSKHIKAVKEPWRWSSRHNALAPDEDEQAVPPIAPQPDAHAIELQPVIDIDDSEIVDGPTVLAYVVLAKTPHDPRDPADVPTRSLPWHEGKLQVFNSTATTFFAPSDLSGTGGMQWEHIHACPL